MGWTEDDNDAEDTRNTRRWPSRRFKDRWAGANEAQGDDGSVQLPLVVYLREQARADGHKALFNTPMDGIDGRGIYDAASERPVRPSDEN